MVKEVSIITVMQFMGNNESDKLDLFGGLFKEEPVNENKGHKKKAIPSEQHNYKPDIYKKYPQFDNFPKNIQDRITKELDTARYFKNSSFPVRNYIPISKKDTPNYHEVGLTDYFIYEFCALVSEGNFKESVFDYLKVPYQIYKQWLETGKKDYDNQDDTIYAYFYGEILRASSTFEFNESSLIKKGDKEWRGSAWHLQRWNSVFKDSYIPDKDTSKDSIEQLKILFEEELDIYKQETLNGFNDDDISNLES